jgi:hypothetical protein
MIHVSVKRNEDESISHIRLDVTEESLSYFITAIDRALNCWDGAPAELKELGDMLTHGRITQDYSKSR